MISGIWLIFIGWFLKNGVDQGLKQTVIMQAVYGLQVSQIMTKTVKYDTSWKTVKEVETEYFDITKHGGFPVVEGAKIIGLVTRTDLRNAVEQEKSNQKVEDIMTPRNKLVIASLQESVADAFMKFSKYDIGRLPVIENESVVGIITRSDVIQAVQIRTRAQGSDL